MALFLPASRYFSQKRLDQVLEVDDQARAYFERDTSGGSAGATDCRLIATHDDVRGGFVDAALFAGFADDACSVSPIETA